MSTVGVGSYGIACAACLGLIVLLSIRRMSRHWTILALVSIVGVWAALGLAAMLDVVAVEPAYRFADILRSLALLFLVDHALRRITGDTDGASPNRWGGFLLPVVGVVAFGIAAFAWSGGPGAAFTGLIGHVGLAVVGLFLIENLLKASRPDALWSTKHLLIGAGTIFAFDLFYYTDALLLLRVDDTLRAAQPVIVTLALPLILISARRLHDVRIHLPISRGFVVGTTALLASGTYILSIAAIAYLIRGLGWAWGPTLQLIFLFGAAMVLLVLLSSTSLRHGGRRFIERNLFTFAYDYRREWLRLVESMAGSRNDLPLDRRALMATATLMDADGGVLFMGAGQGMHYKTSWNVALDGDVPGAPPSSLMEALSITRPALVLDDPDNLPSDVGGHDEIRTWLESFRDPWIALALISRNEVIGLALVTKPRMKRRLSWEDLDILAIFANQLGSYLAVEELARHVAETEHFERMSKHVTFVAHDLKNVISQLSLVLQQAKDHAHDPAFVSDTFLTIGDAVERMKRLMQRVQEGAGQTPLTSVDLSTLAQNVLKEGRVEALTAFEDGIAVKAEPASLRALVDHLIDNAWEAYHALGACQAPGADHALEACQASQDGDDGAPRVSAALREGDGVAVLEIADRGVGMSGAFIETELFRPFTSTKKAGFGIGMYQCREVIERWQGRLDVESAPGKGTTITVTLPLADSRAEENADAARSASIERTKGRAA